VVPTAGIVIVRKNADLHCIVNMLLTHFLFT
jgi:hypothetical protein